MPRLAHTLSVFIIFLTLPHYVLRAADTLELREAIAKKRIQAHFVGHGGLSRTPVELHIVNNVSKALSIAVPYGLQLISNDKQVQNLILLDDAVITVEPRGKASMGVAAACMQQNNHSPKRDEAYRIGSIATGPLFQVAQFVSQNDFFNSSAQAAVWSLTDDYPVNAIHGDADVNLTWDLVKMVALAKRYEPPAKEEFLRQAPMRRIVFAARSDLAYHAPRQMTASLILVDSSGQEIKRYFHNRKLHAGLHIYTVSINNILDEVESFEARLINEHGEVLSNRVLSHLEPYQEIVQQTARVDFEYIVRQAGKITMAVYDMNDNLVEEIFSDRHLPVSKRRANFAFLHNIKDQDSFQVKILNHLGDVLQTEIVNL